MGFLVSEAEDIRNMCFSNILNVKRQCGVVWYPMEKLFSGAVEQSSRDMNDGDKETRDRTKDCMCSRLASPGERFMFN
jgi:hypothetical protein